MIAQGDIDISMTNDLKNKKTNQKISKTNEKI